jgi:hypothetical protein
MKIQKIARWAAIPVGVLVSGVLVLGFSNAAFTAKTQDGNNTWSTGTVNLTNNLTLPMFNYSSAPANKGSADPLMYPGKSLSNTITVNYSGTAPADVRIYSTLGADTGSIAQYLNVTINDGTSNIFTGTLAQLGAKTTYATGVTGWTPTGTASKTYTFTVAMDPSTPQGASGQNIGATTFTWEAQTPAS